MKIEHLRHRHGGKILSLDAIQHGMTGPRRGRKTAYWEFLGRVQWDEGSGSTEKLVSISPVCVCHDPSNKASAEESIRVFAALNDYLYLNGAWVNHVWKPNKPEGRQNLD